MAESDGSLRIQVDLDTKGFKIGVKDLEWAAKRTADKISAIVMKLLFHSKSRLMYFQS